MDEGGAACCCLEDWSAAVAKKPTLSRALTCLKEAPGRCELFRPTYACQLWNMLTVGHDVYITPFQGKKCVATILAVFNGQWIHCFYIFRPRGDFAIAGSSNVAIYDTP